MISKHVYPFSGLIYIISLVGALGFHIAGIVWLAEDDCTDTTWYGMALANTIVFFTFFIIILIGSLITFFVGFSTYSKKNTKVQNRDKENEKDNLAESEERMMPNEENKNNDNATKGEGEKTNEIKPKDKDSNADDHKEGNTEDRDKAEKKDEEEDLEEEEIY